MKFLESEAGEDARANLLLASNQHFQRPKESREAGTVRYQPGGDGWVLTAGSSQTHCPRRSKWQANTHRIS